MLELHDRKIINIAEKYQDYFDIKEKEGYYDPSDLLYLLEHTPTDELIDTEKELLEDVEGVWQHQRDFDKMFKLNKIRIFRGQREYGKKIKKFVESNSS